MRNDDPILAVPRAMAWARAKGELDSVLQTFYPQYEKDGTYTVGEYTHLRETINNFIKTVEENGWVD